jgi:O-antigen/teichoic acid export membrane protein
MHVSRKPGFPGMRLLRSAWNSIALRGAAALGLSGVALAVSNLILARMLPAAEFAQFALLYSIAQVGINIGPIGADVVVARRLVTPGARLYRQARLTSLGVAIVLLCVSAVLYPLSPLLLATAVVSIMGGGLEHTGLAYYRSRDRIGFSLMLSAFANVSLLLASLLALGFGVTSALLPACAMMLAWTATATISWRGIRVDRPDWAKNTQPFPWAIGWAAASFIGAGILLTSLERLVIPWFLGMGELATFAVLATVAGSPFSMLYQAVGYTLVPRLRNATDAQQRWRVLTRESAVIAGTCLLIAAMVLSLMPVMLKWVLAGRYAIGTPLLVAAIGVGLLKVISALAAAAVNAVGSAADMQRMGVVGGVSIGVAVAGAGLGAHWGLTGLVYGVACGWLLRALAVSVLAIPGLAGKSGNADAPGALD